MLPSPWGSLIELIVALVFLGSAAFSWRRTAGDAGTRRGARTVVDVVVGTVALTDAAAGVSAGSVRVGLWTGSSILLLGLTAVALHRSRPASRRR